MVLTHQKGDNEKEVLTRMLEQLGLSCAAGGSASWRHHLAVFSLVIFTKAEHMYIL